MGGFFMMLLKLFLFRLGPLLCLKLCKKRSRLKTSMIIFLFCYGGILLSAIWKLFEEEKWRGILYLPLSMFPHYLFYGFVMWILMRCILYSWSERVWQRIYKVSFVITVLGILTENYWNPTVLEYVLKIF